MVNLRQFKKDMIVTQEELAKVLTPNLRNLMSITPNAGFSIVSDYAFKCSCCASMGLDYATYRALKESHGPGAFNGRASDLPKIKSIKGIVKLDELEVEPEFESHVNVVRNRLVCDHCKDSVYYDKH